MLKKYLIFSLFSLGALAQLFAQAAPRNAEEQLKKTTDKNEEMRLSYEIAQKSLASDPAKASEYAHKAYNLATDLGNNSMMAKAAFVNAEGFNRRKDNSGALIRYTRSLESARKVGDTDISLSCYAKMQDLAIRENNLRQAYNYSLDAIAMLRKSGGTVTKIESAPAAPSASAGGSALNNREREKIIQEKKALEQQVASLIQERNQLSGDKTKSAVTQRQLAKEKDEIKQSLAVKEKEVENMSSEQAKTELVVLRRQRQVEGLKKKQTLDSLKNSIIIGQKDLDLENTQLRLEQTNYLRNILLAISGFVLALAGLFYSRYRSKRNANVVLEDKNKIIETERERSDKLLLNILPPAIAQELKEKGKAQARKYDDATVLFTDFKNFTQIAEQLSPEKLVEELDFYFKGFDAIISKYNIEKIKTIGDAYMCAAGLSGRNSTTTNMVKAALEMRDFMEHSRYEKEQRGEPFFEARIGIHTGPVVAGVVGNDKFAYDIWGDTVNIAARMEQHCEPGYVNISENTFWQVKYDFECAYRGKIAAKNKGEIDMYYVRQAI